MSQKTNSSIRGDAAFDRDIRYTRPELLGILERRVALDRRVIQHDDVREMIVPEWQGPTSAGDLT